MPAKRKGSAQRSAPKQFRCTGYGECSMVFTRSEHLARHERKHTGEKPYKCVVETCGRMFSRFDNMMQHTQTHEKKKSCSPVESDDQAKPKKARAALTGDPVTKSPIEIQEEAFPWFQVDDYSVSPLECSPMLFNRTLPPPYKQKKSSYPGQFAFYPHQYQNSMPQLPVGDSFYNSQNHFLPPVGEMFFQRPYNTHRKRASCPDRKIEYETISSLRRLSGSTASSDSGHINSPQTVMKDFNIKRRISVDALQTPIENLKAIQLDEKPIEKDSVDITQDEYEVLEAFGRFHSSPVTTPQKN